MVFSIFSLRFRRAYLKIKLNAFGTFYPRQIGFNTILTVILVKVG